MSFNTLFFCRNGRGVFRGRSAAPLLMLFAFLIVIAPFVISAAAGAADITYIGDGEGLENVPDWLQTGNRSAVLPTADEEFLSSGNNVTVNYDADADGRVDPYYVIGGLSESDNATDNTVTFTNGKVQWYVYGGYSDSGNAERNTVTISGGSVERNIYGGASRNGNAEYNVIYISGSSNIERSVYGGYVDGRTDRVGSAIGNTVNISGGSLGQGVFGGWSNRGDATNNAVSLSGGNANSNVYGGYSNFNAKYNTVAVIGGEVGGSVYGGYVSGGGDATNNAVTVKGGSVGGNVYGGYSSSTGNAADNNVVMTGGTVKEAVYGGSSVSGNATGNTIAINGGEVGGNVYGGASSNKNSTNNTVTIHDGAVKQGVYGGRSGFGNAAYNNVTINGGSVDGNVYGGYVSNGGGDATNNIVTLDGSPVFSANSYIYGGYVLSPGTGNNFKGNTLNVKSAGISVKGVDNFEYYNFYLPQGMSESYTMLYVADAVNLNDTKINIYLEGNIELEEGAIITLIESNERITNVRDYDPSLASFGSFIFYKFTLYGEGSSFLARMDSVTYSADNKVLTNSRLAPLAFLGQGADLVASLEYPDAQGDGRFTTFAIVGGGSSTYSTGSDVDIDGFSLLAGVTWNAPVKKNSLALSAFVEAGWGSYDTTNNFGGGAVRGSGDTDYYGGGLHMRYKWDSDTPGGLYAEGSLRYGRMTSNFNTDDLQSEKAFHYDSGSNYYGVHAGLGYVWQLSGKTRLDVSGKYLWTHLESDELTSSNGDAISLNSANSNRLRAGFRFYHDYGNANVVTLYYGAAYEYEFDGDADGRLYGTYALDGSSLSGGSGIGELGVMFRPSKDNDRLMMQLGIQGYVGVREGVSGTLKLQYAF